MEYPNPASQQLTVEEVPEGALAELLDYSGRLLLRRPLQSPDATLSLTPFSPGLYLLRIQSEVGTWTEKLLIQR